MRIGDIVRAADLPKGIFAKTLNMRNPTVYQIADDVDPEALRRMVHVIERGGTISPTAIMIESRVMLRVTGLPGKEPRVRPEIVRRPKVDTEPSMETQLEAALEQAESAEAEIAMLKEKLRMCQDDANNHLRSLLKSERALHKANLLLGLSSDQTSSELVEPPV